MWKLFGIFAASVYLMGCAGSPVAEGGKTPQEFADSYFQNSSISEICSNNRNFSTRACTVYYNGREGYCRTRRAAYEFEMDRRGLSPSCCQNVSSCMSAAEVAREWESETYNIDLLKVTAFKSRDSIGCSSGGRHRLLLEGQISPDSSFAMDRLLDRLEPCKNSNGRITDPVHVSLKSGGGFLKDGFALGQTFRENQVHAVIEKSSICASSCAVAFLGASTREVEDKGQIMFHAPYFSGKNEYGQRDIDCDVGKEALAELNDYYISMTDKETGERLFERTMWYCSASDGWVVTGGAAAELYGIATER